MENSYTCYKLSVEGTEVSLRKLLSLYLSGGKEQSKNAKSALKKSWNKDVVLNIIDDALDNIVDDEEYSLLRLAVSIDREKYLYRLLVYAKDNNINISEDGTIKSLEKNPLSITERNQLARYISDFGDYRKKLIYLAGEENKEKILYSCLDHVINNKTDVESLELVASDEEYQPVLIDTIKDAIKVNANDNSFLIKYLDLNEPGSQELLNAYDFFFKYKIIKENKYIDRISECDDFSIRVCSKIACQRPVDAVDWEKLKVLVNEKRENIEDFEGEYSFGMFLVDSAYIDFGFIESVLISLYKQTRLYTNIALKYLVTIKSQFAYREMVSFMLTSENEADKYKNAVKLVQAFPEKGNAIRNYAKDLNDAHLLEVIDEVGAKFRRIKGVNAIQDDSLHEEENEKVCILSESTIVSEFLVNKAEEINAHTFYAAVGFTFASGLKMLIPLFDQIQKNNGRFEIITGALQNCDKSGRNRKIDRNTVLVLNDLIKDSGLRLYTYTEAFFHGKFYYIANDKEAYVVIGSSNISKTAFLNNYELDTLIKIDLRKKSNQFLSWYESFRESCKHIDFLDGESFEDFKWESELDVFSKKYIERMSYDEVKKKIAELSDEETKFRLSSWMQYSPSEIYTRLEIDSLPDYVVFLYAETGLAVFESFVPGNAYYTFRYFDLDTLLKNIAGLSKTQMALSSGFLLKGYHISDQDKFEQKIKKIFAVSRGN